LIATMFQHSRLTEFLLGLFAATSILAPSAAHALGGDGDKVVARVVTFGGACEKCDLSGRRMSGARILGANFSGAALVGSDMRSVRVLGANFSGADLSRADLTDSEMIGSNFSNANLSSARLGGYRPGSRLQFSHHGQGGPA